jgi:hypothetical protein
MRDESNHQVSPGEGGAAIGPRGGDEPHIGFPDGPAVDVQEIDDREWRVLKSFTYFGQRDHFTVPVDEKTDFASVPRPFVWFIPTYGRYTKAAILHDYLCRLAREGTFNRRDADGLFRQAMRTLGVAFLRRWIMWAAVRWGSLAHREGRQDWGRDALNVIVLTLLVFPILLPAALLIVLTLIVWYVVELLAWAPLAFTRQTRVQQRKPVKRVNQPTLSMRL